MLHARGTGGLQVLPPGSVDWQWIKPLPGHAVCNVGDTLGPFHLAAMPRSQLANLPSLLLGQPSSREASCEFLVDSSNTVLSKLFEADQIPRGVFLLSRSNIHRVVTPPGEQSKHVRWSLVNFLRPSFDEELFPLGHLSPQIAEAAAKDPVMSKLERGTT